MKQNYSNVSTEELRIKLDSLLEGEYFNEAENVIIELLSRDNSDLQALYARGWFYVKNISFEEALRVYENIIDIDPTDHKPYALLGEIYEQLAQNEPELEEEYSTLAIENYNKALQYDSRDTFSWIGLGRIDVSKKNWNNAIKMLEEAINCDETVVEAWLYKSIALDKSGKPQEALKSIEEAKFRDPDDKRIIINEIWIKFQLLMVQEAMQLIEDALENYPDDEDFKNLKKVITHTNQQKNKNPANNSLET